MGELLLQYTEMSQFQEFHWWYSGTANVRERGRSCGELTVCSFQFEWQSGVASKKNDLRVDFVFAQHVRSQNKITQHGGREDDTSIK
jgi:hypothetical protein